MKPLVTPIYRCKQGSMDEDSPWAKARYKWVTQLAVRFGLLKLSELANEEERKWCKDLDKAENQLHWTQVVHFDETHKKVLCGLASKTSRSQTRFPRDKDGRLDLTNGSYGPEKFYLK